MYNKSRGKKMGSEISNRDFSEEDYDNFWKAYKREIAYINKLFEQGGAIFSNEYRVGYELEACILDHSNVPNPINKKILSTINSPLFTHELANYDLEINGNIFKIDADALENLESDMFSLWDKAKKASQKHNANLGLFGVLPSLEFKHFNKDLFQSDMHRYTLFSQRLRELREEPVKLLFHGKDEVALEKDDVMLEALGTSLQIHLQIPFDKAVEYYHASLIASVVLVGFGANSPLVLGKRAWHESRIPIFEQSVDTRAKKRRDNGDEKRVHFAHDYIDSWLDLLEQNDAFKIIFADVRDTLPNKLHHFNLHNGTIWRWIRPILGEDSDGKHTLRLELRVLPAGPTLIDTHTNIWFFIGLVHGLVISNMNLQKIPFQMLKNDFYTVAKQGLEAEFHEPQDAQKVALKDWILQEGIALCKKGLDTFGVEHTRKYLDIIKQRTLTTQTGAAWQLKHYEKYHSIKKLMEDYMKNSDKNIPIHEWEL